MQQNHGFRNAQNLIYSGDAEKSHHRLRKMGENFSCRLGQYSL